MVLAEVGLWELMWSFLWLFFLFIWLLILFQILIDLFRDHGLSGWAKAAWVVAFFIFPFLSVLVYLIVRGRGMAERNMKQQVQAKQDFDQYVQSVAAAGPTPADQIAKAKELLDSGVIDQAEFDKLKAKALA